MLGADDADVVLLIESTSGWGDETYPIVAVRRDGRIAVHAPGSSVQAPLVGRLTNAQVRELEADAEAAGLGVEDLDLEDPLPGMSVSDAGSVHFTARIEGRTYGHAVYALGSMGERDSYRSASGTPDPWVPEKRAGRIALIDLMNHAVAVALQAAGSDAPFTDDEQTLAGAAAALGLETARMERPTERGAVLWAPNDFQMLLLTSEPDAGAFADGDTLEEREIGGTVVRTVSSRDGSGDIADRFTCGDLSYTVSNTSGTYVNPFGFSDNQDLLTQLIAALGC